MFSRSKSLSEGKPSSKWEALLWLFALYDEARPCDEKKSAGKCLRSKTTEPDCNLPINLEFSEGRRNSLLLPSADPGLCNLQDFNDLLLIAAWKWQVGPPTLPPLGTSCKVGDRHFVGTQCTSPDFPERLVQLNLVKRLRWVHSLVVFVILVFHVPHCSWGNTLLLRHTPAPPNSGEHGSTSQKRRREGFFSWKPLLRRENQEA